MRNALRFFSNLILLIAGCIFCALQPVLAQSVALSEAEVGRIKSEAKKLNASFVEVLEARERALRLHVGDNAVGAEALRDEKRARDLERERAKEQWMKKRVVYSSEAAEVRDAADQARLKAIEAERELVRERYVTRRDAKARLRQELQLPDLYIELRIDPWVEPDFKSSFASPDGFKPSAEN
jgi:hypothetical protein